MNSEFLMDLYFVRHHDSGLCLHANIEDQLEAMFSKNARWHLEAKKEDGLDIVVVELKGSADWTSTEEAVSYLEDKAGFVFWDTIKGLQIQVILKQVVGYRLWKKEKDSAG